MPSSSLCSEPSLSHAQLSARWSVACVCHGRGLCRMLSGVVYIHTYIQKMSHFFASSRLHKISMASASEGSTADTFFDADAAFGLAGPRHLAGASGVTMPRAQSRKVGRGGAPRRVRASKGKAVEGAFKASSRPGFSTTPQPGASRSKERSLVTTCLLYTSDAADE